MKNKLATGSIIATVLCAVAFIAMTAAMIYLTVYYFNNDLLDSLAGSSSGDAGYGLIIIALLALFVDSVAKFFGIILVVAFFIGACAYAALSILRFIFVKKEDKKASATVCVVSVIFNGFIIFNFLSSLKGLLFVFRSENLSLWAILFIALALIIFIATAISFALSLADLIKYTKNKSDVSEQN